MQTEADYQIRLDVIVELTLECLCGSGTEWLPSTVVTMIWYRTDMHGTGLYNGSISLRFSCSTRTPTLWIYFFLSSPFCSHLSYEPTTNHLKRARPYFGIFFSVFCPGTPFPPVPLPLPLAPAVFCGTAGGNGTFFSLNSSFKGAGYPDPFISSSPSQRIINTL